MWGLYVVERDWEVSDNGETRLSESESDKSDCKTHGLPLESDNASGTSGEKNTWSLKSLTTPPTAHHM
jgi:hypothetical protein